MWTTWGWAVAVGVGAGVGVAWLVPVGTGVGVPAGEAVGVGAGVGVGDPAEGGVLLGVGGGRNAPVDEPGLQPASSAEPASAAYSATIGLRMASPLAERRAGDGTANFGAARSLLDGH
jgi:hypothetical protein